MTGRTKIEAERKRQIHSEGWSLESDDGYVNRELMRAAHCYARNDPTGWPWDESWWKPSQERSRDYEKAGALYLAEKERLERAGDPIRARLMKLKSDEMADLIDELLIKS